MEQVGEEEDMEVMSPGSPGTPLQDEPGSEPDDVEDGSVNFTTADEPETDKLEMEQPSEEVQSPMTMSDDNERYMLLIPVFKITLFAISETQALGFAIGA